MYIRAGSESWAESKVLVSPDAAGGQFGWSLSMLADNSVLAVGANVRIAFL